MFQEKYNRIVLPIIFLYDALIIFIVYKVIILSDQQFPVFLVTIIWCFCSLIFKSYKILRTYSILIAIRPAFSSLCLFYVLYVLFIQLNIFTMYSSIDHIYFLLSFSSIFIISSILRFNLFYLYRVRGRNTRYAVLLTSDLDSNNIEELIEESNQLGYLFIKTIDSKENYINGLKNLALNKRIDIVFLKGNDKDLTESVSLLCDELGIRLKLILQLSSSTGRRAGLHTIAGFPVIDVRHEPLLYLGNRITKRFIDILIALLSITFVLSWLPFVIKIAQYISFPGPLLFIQDRIGRDGKVFRLYKFRTMYLSKDIEDAQRGESIKTKETDNRIPWFGRLLRRSNLDEYPQFINVLFGSMSTVGPRPHMVGEDKILEKRINRYRIRRFVKPGLTGWAAINGYRGGTDDLNLMLRRTEHDIWYLENWTIWLDLKIIFTTILQMITFRIPKAY